MFNSMLKLALKTGFGRDYGHKRSNYHVNFDEFAFITSKSLQKNIVIYDKNHF